MTIAEATADTDLRRGRPWWFGPALIGIVLGGVVGFASLPTPLPACSPVDASSELVVLRFLERLGSSEAAIQECWTPGRLSQKELQTYLRARPPKTISLVNHYLGQGDGRVLIQWETVLTWTDGPPEGWRADEPRFIMLARHDGPTRWTIELTQPPLRP